MKDWIEDFFTLKRNISIALVTSAGGLQKQEYCVVRHNQEEYYQQQGVNSSEESLWLSRRFPPLKVRTWPFWL